MVGDNSDQQQTPVGGEMAIPLANTVVRLEMPGQGSGGAHLLTAPSLTFPFSCPPGTLPSESQPVSVSVLEQVEDRNGLCWAFNHKL